MKNTIETVKRLLERAARPGVLGLAGQALENRTRVDLGLYFRHLGQSLDKLNLGNLATNEHSEEIVRMTVNMSLNNILRRVTPDLLLILTVALQTAMMRADKIDVLAEAVKARPTIVDKVGLTAEDAANYAASKAGELIKGINDTTRQKIADTIVNGIKEQKGVEAVGQDIRSLMSDMSLSRSRIIASTEINDAMSEATLRKLKRLDVTYKQLITSDDACPICGSIEDAGPVPTDEPFVDEDGEEYDRTPIHVGCRCATTGARAPEGEDS